MSPRQVSSEYRNQEQRSLIGFGIFYRNQYGIVDCINIDLVSKNPDQKGYNSVNAFK